MRTSEAELDKISDNLQQMLKIIDKMDYVASFKEAEKILKETETIWENYRQMKNLQKEAVFFQKIGKRKFYQGKSQEAKNLEEALKENPLVQNYYQKMQNVNDLLKYISSEIEEKVNQKLIEKERP